MRGIATAPTPEQTLVALARVSRGEVWNGKPQTSTWRSIGEVAAGLVGKHYEAAE